MVKTGKAAVMTQIMGDLEFQSYPVPGPEKGAIVVKITCCTICGSDVLACAGPLALPADGRFPTAASLRASAC